MNPLKSSYQGSFRANGLLRTLRPRHWNAFVVLFLCLLGFHLETQAQSARNGSDATRRTVGNDNLAGPSSSSLSVLKEGDALRIMFFPDTNSFINGVYPIDRKGSILLPILGRTRVGYMNEEELAVFLNKSYTDYLRYPNVRVQPLIRVSFLGGFHKPGLFYVAPSASLWDAVRMAGGTLREDGFKRMKWERHGELVSKDLLPQIESGRSMSEIGLESGDQFWVTSRPKSYFSMTFLVTTLTTSIAVYSTYRLLTQ